MTDTTDPYRTFRSRRGRQAAIIFIVLELVLLSIVGVTLPPPFGLFEKAEMVVIALLVAYVLWRFASVSATPSPQGLRVRNLVRTTELEWHQIVTVRMGGGNPWATLDLDDTDTLAVMAIQRADGDWGEAEARRLAGLVARHSRTDHNN